MNYKKKNYNKNQTYHALLEQKTDKILALTTHMISVTKLSETIHNSYCVYYINTPNIHFIPKIIDFDYISHVISFDNFNIEEMFRYRIYKGKLLKDVEITDILYSNLIANKGFALDYINKFITHFRRPFNMDIGLQQETYHLKHHETLDFFDNKRDFYPFIQSYSELKNITLEQAAKEIKIQSEFYLYSLSNIENLRIKYTNLILDLNNEADIDTVLSDFMNEGVFYGYM